jgi:hypothetical protein
MRRFLVFAWHEARGGFQDFISSHDSLEVALLVARSKDCLEHGCKDNWHVLDSETWEIVRQSITI